MSWPDVSLPELAIMGNNRGASAVTHLCCVPSTHIMSSPGDKGDWGTTEPPSGEGIAANECRPTWLPHSLPSLLHTPSGVLTCTRTPVTVWGGPSTPSAFTVGLCIQLALGPEGGFQERGFGNPLWGPPGQLWMFCPQKMRVGAHRCSWGLYTPWTLLRNTRLGSWYLRASPLHPNPGCHDGRLLAP